MTKFKNIWVKCTHWEYWPFAIINIPVFFVSIYYILRSKGSFYFNAANPKIQNGGFLMESKKEIYDTIPSHLIPETILIQNTSSTQSLLNDLKLSNIKFPLICKPDIGLRGLGVAKISDEEQLVSYHKNCPTPYLIQSFIMLPLEAGIFYYRMPNETNGRISGIVYKEMLSVVGNGVHTLKQLILQEERAALQLQALEINYGKKLEYVPQLGEMYNLVPFGNHSRGAKFLDYSHKITDELNSTFNTIFKDIPEFHFGRLDIKFNSWEELIIGENICIIELNGSGSEPTHIYDPKHSIWFAWKELLKHQNILYKISKQKNKSGTPYLTLQNGLSIIKANNKLVAQLTQFQLSGMTR